jgi:hypothetical protein
MPVHQAVPEKSMLKKQWDSALIPPRVRDQYGLKAPERQASRTTRDFLTIPPEKKADQERLEAPDMFESYPLFHILFKRNLSQTLSHQDYNIIVLKFMIPQFLNSLFQLKGPILNFISPIMSLPKASFIFLRISVFKFFFPS